MSQQNLNQIVSSSYQPCSCSFSFRITLCRGSYANLSLDKGIGLLLEMC